MSASQFGWKVGCLVLVCGLLLPGCGSSPTDTAGSGTSESTGDKSAGGSGAGNLPTAAIGAGQLQTAQVAEETPTLEDDSEEAETVAVPEAGTPEWKVKEATRLRLEAPPKTDDVEALRASRKQRNEKIIELAQQVIAATHKDALTKDAPQERLSNVAVHQLMEARLEMAMQGDRDSIDALYEDAAALAKRDPKSAAAAEASFHLVQLAYSHAKGSAKNDVRWLEEFARQASHFATFPQEERRCVPLLFTAARSCELYGLADEALHCYETIQQRFPKSPYAQRVVGILRRLKLAGVSAQISGPLLGGGEASIDDLQGKAVLVVFWSSEAKPFQSQLPTVLATVRKHASAGLSVLGVNLDKESAAANQFVLQNRITWPQIFFPEPERRGWNNPVANFYGITDIPTFWLVDRDGRVVSTQVTAADLDNAISDLLAK